MNAYIVGDRVFLTDFVNGTRVVELKPRTAVPDVLAQALWIECHLGSEQADQYLDEYLQTRPPVTFH